MLPSTNRQQRKKRRGAGRVLAPMRSPHQRRARPPWTSTLGPKPSSDVRACCCSRSWSSAALEEKAKLRRRVCRLQHARWRDGLGGRRFLCVRRCCGSRRQGHGGRGGFGDRAGLQNHRVLLVSQPAASASAARPIHCDRSAPRGKRAAPLERRNSDDDPRGVRAAAARRRCGVCIERVAVCRMGVFRFGGVVVGVESTVPCGHATRGAASVPWAPRRCGVRSITKHCACANAARTTHNIAIQRDQLSVPNGLTRRLCSLWEWRPASAACTPRAAPPESAPHSPARRRRRPSSPAPRR